MSHRPAILRTLCSVMAVGLLVAAGWFALETRRTLAELAQWRDARPLEMTAELSKPGTYRGQIRPSLRRPHSQGLYLEMSNGEVLARDEALAGLTGRIVVLADRGKEVHRGELPQPVPPDHPPADDGLVWLTDIPPLDAGEYTLELRVTQGAAALAGARQRLFTRYDLNRADLIPTRLSLLIATITAAAGLILAVVATVAFRTRPA